MYFLTAQEQRYLAKGVPPRAREATVSEELRGWNWDKPPLQPVHETVRLGVAEVADLYCPTGRDVYLQRSLQIRQEPSEAMRRGQALHDVVSTVVTEAKRALYRGGIEGWKTALERVAPPADLDAAARALWEFEVRRVTARVEEVLSRHPGVGVDGLVSLAVPVVVEMRLDGSPLGLSSQLRADAVMLGEPLVFDVKFGEPKDFHVLSLAGYALVLEALLEQPVNVGCLVYARFDGSRWSLEREFHLLDEAVRQWFLEVRDEKQEMVFSERDPGVPGHCPRDCPFFGVCHDGRVPDQSMRGLAVAEQAVRPVRLGRRLAAPGLREATGGAGETARGTTGNAPGQESHGTVRRGRGRGADDAGDSGVLHVFLDSEDGGDRG